MLVPEEDKQLQLLRENVNPNEHHKAGKSFYPKNKNKTKIKVNAYNKNKKERENSECKKSTNTLKTTADSATKQPTENKGTQTEGTVIRKCAPQNPRKDNAKESDNQKDRVLEYLTRHNKKPTSDIESLKELKAREKEERKQIQAEQEARKEFLKANKKEIDIHYASKLKTIRSERAKHHTKQQKTLTHEDFCEYLEIRKQKLLTELRANQKAFIEDQENRARAENKRAHMSTRERQAVEEYYERELERKNKVQMQRARQLREEKREKYLLQNKEDSEKLQHEINNYKQVFKSNLHTQEIHREERERQSRIQTALENMKKEIEEEVYREREKQKQLLAEIEEKEGRIERGELLLSRNEVKERIKVNETLKRLEKSENHIAFPVEIRTAFKNANEKENNPNQEIIENIIKTKQVASTKDTDDTTSYFKVSKAKARKAYEEKMILQGIWKPRFIDQWETLQKSKGIRTEDWTEEEKQEKFAAYMSTEKIRKPRNEED